MPNENCLAGVKCPECGHEDDFDIVVLVTVRMTDEGSDLPQGDEEWDDESPITCCACKHSGLVGAFRLTHTDEEE